MVGLPEVLYSVPKLSGSKDRATNNFCLPTVGGGEIWIKLQMILKCLSSQERVVELALGRGESKQQPASHTRNSVPFTLLGGRFL